MSYAKDLTFELRLRGLPDEQIAAIIADVRSHCADGQLEPEEEFGPATEYAHSLVPATQKRVWTPGRVLMAVGLGSAVAYVLVALLGPPLLDFDFRVIVGPVMLWPALAIIVLTAAVGLAIDMNRPLRTPSSRPN